MYQKTILINKQAILPSLSLSLSLSHVNILNESAVFLPYTWQQSNFAMYLPVCNWQPSALLFSINFLHKITKKTLRKKLVGRSQISLLGIKVKYRYVILFLYELISRFFHMLKHGNSGFPQRQWKNHTQHNILYVNPPLVCI